MCALGMLVGRIADAEAGDLAAMVDVVWLSLGYFSESVADVAYGSGLWQVIDTLLGVGVVVGAAAGNYATSPRGYPPPTPGHGSTADHAPLLGVGPPHPTSATELFHHGRR